MISRNLTDFSRFQGLMARQAFMVWLRIPRESPLMP